MASPKLRFKEFDGDWDKTTLGKVVEFSNGKRIPLSESDRQKRQGSYRYYGASGVIDHIDDYIFDGQYILIGEDGANILTRSSPLAFTVEGKFWVNNHAHIFQSKDGDNFFLATYLETLNYERFNSGTAQPKLNLENLKKVPVANPSKEEQTKIASFLSAVDEKISQLTQKHELLSQYKQGMMQKLFSQQIRFKADDGSEFGEWDYVDLGSMSDVTKLAGYEFTKHIVYKDTGQVIALRGLNVKNNKLDLSEVKYIDDSDLNMLSRSKLFIQDLLFTYVGTIGEVALIQENDRFYLAPNVARIRVDTALLNPYFLLQYFNDHHFKRNEIEKYIATSSQPALSMTNIRKFKIATPSLEEQIKIANFLSAIDQKIEVVAQQIEQAKQWKKGLLQQMFV